MWTEYLAALERYLGEIPPALARGKVAPAPVALGRRPLGPVPSEHTRRAGQLLARIEGVVAATSTRREEVLAARMAVARRRHRFQPLVGQHVDSAL